MYKGTTDYKMECQCWGGDNRSNKQSEIIFSQAWKHKNTLILLVRFGILLIQ